LQPCSAARKKQRFRLPQKATASTLTGTGNENPARTGNTIDFLNSFKYQSCNSIDTMPALKKTENQVLKMLEFDPAATKEIPMNKRSIHKRLQLFIILALASGRMAGAEPTAAATPPGTETAASLAPHKPSLEEISAKINNPLSDLWMIWTQYDHMIFNGDLSGSDRTIDVAYFEPVISIPVGDKWNLVNRPVFTYISAEVPNINLPPNIGSSAGGSYGGAYENVDKAALQNVDWNTKKGWGDLILLSMLSPKELPDLGNGKLAWGTGVTTMFPTASRDYFGSEKYSAGPAALAIYMGPKWKIGALGQQWWSVAGDKDREDVNRMNIQYFWFYSLPNLWQIGAAPNITANWQADSDNRWTVPLGIGINKTVMIGKLPVRFVLEYHKTVIQPDAFGKDWGVRFVVIPVIPNLIEMAQGKLKLP
jgi:hypothetical protein